MKYIVNSLNMVIGSVSSMKVNFNDLSSRGEFIVDTNKEVELPAKFVDGEVVHINS